MLNLGGHRGAVRAVEFLADGRLVSAGQDGRVLLHPPGGGPAVRRFKSPRPVYALAAHPGGDQFALAGRPAAGDVANPVTVLDLTPGSRPTTLPCTVEDQVPVGPGWPPRFEQRPVARTVWSVAWSADGRFLAAAVRRPGRANIPEGGGGRWWELTTGASSPLPDDAYAVRFAPAGHEVAVSRRQAVEGFAHPADDTPAWRLPTSAAWAAMAFGPAGGPVVAAAGAFLYPRGGKRVKTGLRAVTAVAVTTDGSAVLAGGVPGGVEVYDADSRTRRATFDFGVGSVHALAVAPDGLTTAVAGDAGLAVFDL